MVDETRTIKIDAEIPQGEYELLVHYAKGATIRQLASEKNTTHRVIISVIRRNLARLLATDRLISKSTTSRRAP